MSDNKYIKGYGIIVILKYSKQLLKKIRITYQNSIYSEKLYPTLYQIVCLKHIRGVAHVITQFNIETMFFSLIHLAILWVTFSL